MRTIGRAFLTLLPTLLLVLGLGVVTATPAAAATTVTRTIDDSRYGAGGLANQHEPCFDVQINLQGWHDQYRTQIFYSRYESPNTCTGENATVISGVTTSGDVNIATNLSTGTIRATIPLTDGQSTTVITSVTVNETFTATGRAVRSVQKFYDDGTDPNYTRQVTEVRDQAPATSVGYPDQAFLIHDKVTTVTRVKAP